MGRVSESLRGQAALIALFALIAAFWGANLTGFLVSNDGSHIALARALALRGETRIDPDKDLTIGIDLAERDGHQYSDRPPGTAFLALPAIWFGAQLDAWLFERSREHGGFVAAPACPAYLATYAEHYPDGRPLATYQGTALAAGVHAVIVGLLGLLALERLLLRFGVDLGGRLFALFGVGVGSLWGPYSTVLLSHGSAIACTAGFMLAVERVRVRKDAAPGLSALAGLAGAAAIACEYSLLIVVPTAVLLLAPRRSWMFVAAGAVPVAIVTALYHAAAFGSPFAIGYDHHVTFDFAHSLRTTFAGSIFEGLWTLLGLGSGAGVLARSPVLWVGFAALLTVREGSWGTLKLPHAVTSLRRWLAAFAPWVALLALHETPWGGATQDYRYLAPLLPLLGVGLGLAWQRAAAANPALAVLLVLLAMFSAHLVWFRFVRWHGAGVFPSLAVGLVLGSLVAMYGGLFAAVVSRRKTVVERANARC